MDDRRQVAQLEESGASQDRAFLQLGSTNSLDMIIRRNAPVLSQMLVNAEDNRLYFNDMKLVYTKFAEGSFTKKGVLKSTQELYLAIKLGDDDQHVLNKNITGITKNYSGQKWGWHISVGHFMAWKGETKSSVNDKITHFGCWPMS